MSDPMSLEEATQYRQMADRINHIRVIASPGEYLVLDAPLHSITTRLTIDLETRKYTSTNQIPNQQHKEKTL